MQHVRCFLALAISVPMCDQTKFEVSW